MSDAPARASSNSDARASSASNAERTSAVATAAAAASAPKKFALPASNRTSLFNSKKDYESKRRAHLESQFQSSALYWRSARNLLNDAVLETDRARELVEARCHIDRLYAESMEAVARGDVDEQNKPMTGDAKATKKKKKVNKEREAYIQGQNGGMLQVNKDGLLESKVTSDAGLLSSLIVGHNDIAARYNENVAALTNEVVPELNALCTSLTASVSKIEKVGDALVFEIEAAENKVKEAWAQYEDAASRSLNNSDGNGTPVANGDVTLLENSECVWLFEMKYVLAVVLLQKSFRQCSDGLAEVFKQMKELEYNRRLRLRNLMLVFMQKQEQLWVALPAMSAPTMQRMQETAVDRETVDVDIGKAIRAEAQNIQMQESHKDRKGSLNSSLTNLSLDEATAAASRSSNAPAVVAAPAELESPLSSEFLGKVKVIEKKKDGLMGGWRSCLAIVTCDNYLHLFDLPGNLKIQAGSAPEVAFQQLIPAVEVPAIDFEAAGKGKMPEKWEDVTREWHNGLVPTESIALPNCEVKFVPKVNDQAFEIIETTFNTGASKMFSKTSSRKFTLKAVNQSEAVDWIVSLQSQR